MSIHVIKDSTKEIVDILANYLPKIVWIGPTKYTCQPAYLTREDDFLEYIMSNEKMRSILDDNGGYGGDELLSPQSHYFSEWKEFEEWTADVLKEANNIEMVKHKLDNVFTAKKNVNAFFQHEIFNLTPCTQSIIPGMAFQSQSVKLLLKQLVMDLESTLKKEKEDMVLFLIENNFGINVCEEINPQTVQCLLESFKENYESTYHFDVEHIYNACSLDLDVVTYEMFAEIANVPLSMSILFLQKKRKEKEDRKLLREEEEAAEQEQRDKEEHEKKMRQQMRDAWIKRI